MLKAIKSYIPVEKQNDVVLQSLFAANYLIKSAGIGANPINDIETKKFTLLSSGLKDDFSEHLLQEQYIKDLMENETYKLCANI